MCILVYRFEFCVSVWSIVCVFVLQIFVILCIAFLATDCALNKKEVLAALAIIHSCLRDCDKFCWFEGQFQRESSLQMIIQWAILWWVWRISSIFVSFWAKSKEQWVNLIESVGKNQYLWVVARWICASCDWLKWSSGWLLGESLMCRIGGILAFLRNYNCTYARRDMKSVDWPTNERVWNTKNKTAPHAQTIYF